ncbi:antibiotic biosynthesis monooxygenase family protein [Pseudomonas sp. CCI3.2]|uniref:putative quinol monooxygenase n=1 Tax=unclassified Pseudomonas TaxID=196821 RepID=UPI002AC8ECF1|nr:MULTISPECIES: antibiotic biosynthesis monooxygenase family protein [unclassified Pseudomonas]MEB0075577.1 antibiotic biosynthesis monooxygenase family protein [Pseudomonas sp. MH10out]MEB0103849.1 antibiotic biosynthesis monooxygenase family protein [Pseudomonas sp. CCI3.2]MEB0130388.1 antibiotic biosynthesis monooxygenase family protein [Pseudomonas sp. CCI2.4]MEB0159412.1 antibiotic biosynthesis monooxygenase family protein [Pseudomonas sp. AH2 (2023)]MEB0170158.1 antibiotic biosynthesis 
MHTPNPVSHLAFARASAGRSSHLGARLSSLIEPALKAPGCLQFSLQQSMHDPDMWVVSGMWSSAETMDAWFATPALNVFAEVVQQLIVSSLDFQTFKHVSSVQAKADCLPPLQQLAS